MLEFKDKTAVVTGAAHGVGRALVFAFAKEGMNVVLADINQDSLNNTLTELQREGYNNCLAVKTDVTDLESVVNLAKESFNAFGKVHILCNNAGVGLAESKRKIWTLPNKDWDWGFAVNTMGAVNGIQAFVPKMLEMDEECHLINTSSSNGGLTSLATTPIYAASKAAVTSLTEVLHYQLLEEKSKLKASVMFPGPHLVNTNILNSNISRPERFSAENGKKPGAYVDMKELAKSAGIAFKLTEPEEVATYTLEGIRQDQFWILPPSEKQDKKLQDRTNSILQRKNPQL
ncbi:MAG: SDR family oxidoreductase [Zetaproteobacteria bacterium]|nr:SDR family oxidoreductase [Pseudobdellovibrionaceae bacterium]